ncbi:MAG: peptide chain release factor N(5)-glutamine methyltransferase [Treponema sp.]
MFTIADARRYARQAFVRSPMLARNAHQSFMLDADVLLQQLLTKPRAWLLAHDDADIAWLKPAFEHMVAQRCTGLPIAYITGVKEFFNLTFAVTPAVLIPKPDTELLVERSLAILRRKRAGDAAPLCILDPCTGSGCVIIALLASLFAENQRQKVMAVAVDISPAALTVAKQNAARLLPPAVQECCRFIEGDLRYLTRLHKELPGDCALFDLIAANPPYIPSAQAAALLTDGRNEPLLALDGGVDGLDFITALADNAHVLLKKGGTLLTETDTSTAQTVAALFRQSGLSSVCMHKDMAHMDRLIEGTLQ